MIRMNYPALFATLAIVTSCAKMKPFAGGESPKEDGSDSNNDGGEPKAVSSLEDWQRQLTFAFYPERLHSIKSIEETTDDDSLSSKSVEEYNDQALPIKEVMQRFYNNKISYERTSITKYDDKKFATEITDSTISYDSETGKESKRTEDSWQYTREGDGPLGSRKSRMIKKQDGLQRAEIIEEYKEDDLKFIRTETTSGGDTLEIVSEKPLLDAWTYTQTTKIKNGKLTERRTLNNLVVSTTQFKDGDEAKSTEVSKTTYADPGLHEMVASKGTDSDGNAYEMTCKKDGSDVSCTNETKKNGVVISRMKAIQRIAVISMTYKNRLMSTDVGPELYYKVWIFRDDGTLSSETENTTKVTAKNLPESREYAAVYYKDDGKSIDSNYHSRTEYKYDLDGTRPTEEITTDVKTGKVEKRKVFKY